MDPKGVTGLRVCFSKCWFLSYKIFLAPCHHCITKNIFLKPSRALCGFYPNAWFSSILDLSAFLLLGFLIWIQSSPFLPSKNLS